MWESKASNKSKVSCLLTLVSVTKSNNSSVFHAYLLTPPVYLLGLGAYWVPALPFSQCSLRHLHVSSCGGANHHFYEVHYGRGWHSNRWVQIEMTVLNFLDETETLHFHIMCKKCFIYYLCSHALCLLYCTGGITGDCGQELQYRALYANKMMEMFVT